MPLPSHPWAPTRPVPAALTDRISGQRQPGPAAGTPGQGRVRRGAVAHRACHPGCHRRVRDRPDPGLRRGGRRYRWWRGGDCRAPAAPPGRRPTGPVRDPPPPSRGPGPPPPKGQQTRSGRSDLHPDPAPAPHGSYRGDRPHAGRDRDHAKDPRPRRRDAGAQR